MGLLLKIVIIVILLFVVLFLSIPATNTEFNKNFTHKYAFYTRLFFYGISSIISIILGIIIKS